MGTLSKFESLFANVQVKIPERIEVREELNLPKIVLKDTRLKIPTKTEKSYIDALMVAHNVEEYRRSKAEVVLLPQVNIEISKIIDINKEELRTLNLKRLR